MFRQQLLLGRHAGRAAAPRADRAKLLQILVCLEAVEGDVFQFQRRGGRRSVAIGSLIAEENPRRHRHTAEKDDRRYHQRASSHRDGSTSSRALSSRHHRWKNTTPAQRRVHYTRCRYCGNSSSAHTNGWSDAPLSRMPASTQRSPRAMIQSIRPDAFGPSFSPTGSQTPGVPRSRRIWGSLASLLRSPRRTAGSAKARNWAITTRKLGLPLGVVAAVDVGYQQADCGRIVLCWAAVQGNEDHVSIAAVELPWQRDPLPVGHRQLASRARCRTPGSTTAGWPRRRAIACRAGGPVVRLGPNHSRRSQP